MTTLGASQQKWGENIDVGVVLSMSESKCQIKVPLKQLHVEQNGPCVVASVSRARCENAYFNTGGSHKG